jgi:hypothetical protein
MTSTSEALPRKKKIHAGHRASETRLLNQIDAILGDTHPDSDRLALLKLSLKEKLETLKLLVSEIVELTPEEGLVKEIEQADEYKENVYRALTGIDKFHAATSAPASPLGRVTASHGQQGQIDKDKSRQTAMSLFTGAQSSVPSPVRCYCQNSHPSTECSTVPSASARRQVLRTSGRCFNCLRKGHLSRDCRSANRWHKCKKKHHSSIYLRRTVSRSAASSYSPTWPCSTSQYSHHHSSTETHPLMLGHQRQAPCVLTIER